MNYARLVITTTLLAGAGISSADPNDTAESAFARGQAAQKAGRIHQACDAYEASDKLAARVETEQSLASCYEQDGKPMTAARLYRSIADKDSNADRRKASIAKAAKLEAKAPRLRFAINPMPAGLIVKVDGVEVSSTNDIPVDVGPHEVTATAPGYQGHASAPVDRDHAIIDVIVRMEPAPTQEPPPAAAPAPLPPPSPTTTPAPSTEPTPMATPAPMAATAEPSPTDHRMRNGIIVGAAGVGVLVGSAILYGLSSSKFDDEHTLCPDSKCANNAVLANAESLLSDGRTYRGFGIGTSVAGGLLLVASGYLLRTPHKEESHVALHVGRDGAGIAYTTGF